MGLINRIMEIYNRNTKINHMELHNPSQNMELHKWIYEAPLSITGPPLWIEGAP